MRSLLLMLCASAALVGCSSKNNDTAGGIGSVVKAQAKVALAQRAAKKSGNVAKPKKLTHADIAGVKTPLVQVSVPKIGYKELAKKVSGNFGYDNYYTATNKSFVVRNGQLTATRGLRYDLMSRTLTSDPRTYRYLSAVNGIAQLQTSCETIGSTPDTIKILEKTYNLTVTEEVCRNSFVAFKNRVWRDGRGKAWKAQQWIGQEEGFAVIEWLN